MIIITRLNLVYKVQPCDYTGYRKPYQKINGKYYSYININSKTLIKVYIIKDLLISRLFPCLLNVIIGYA